MIPAFQKRRLARSHAASQARSGIQDSPGIKHDEPGNPQKMEWKIMGFLMWKIMLENPTIKKDGVDWDFEKWKYLEDVSSKP